MPAARSIALVVGLLGGVTGLAADDPVRPNSVVADGGSGHAGSATASPADESSALRPGDPVRYWASAEYVFGWIRGAASAPLLTAMPAGGGIPSVLFPNDRLNGDVRSGFQLR